MRKSDTANVIVCKKHDTGEMTSRKNAIPVTLQILHLYDRIRKNLIDVCPRDHHVVQVAVYFTNENYSLNGIM